MITFPRIRAAAYAIGMRLQGYHLLKNPKGVSRSEVNMIKQEFYGITSNWDDIFHINRIKKVYTKSGAQSESGYLTSVHFYDSKTGQMTSPRKKDISLSLRRNKDCAGYLERNDLAWEQVDKRTVPKLSVKRNLFLACDSKLDKMCYSKMEAERNRGYYKKKYTIGQKLFSFGLHKKTFPPSENRPNFFKVLYQNLTNKG